MALKDIWLGVAFEATFPMGLVLMGGIEPMTEFNQDRSAPKRQKLDLDHEGNGTGKRLWKGTVTDPSGSGAKSTSFDVTFVAEVQPVPSAAPLMPGITPIELEGLQLKPKIQGSGEFKSIGWNIRATGIKGDNSGSKQAPSGQSASRPTDKAA